MRYIPARNHGPAGANHPITRVVVHGTVTPCAPGEAVAVAKMFATTSRDASTQYVHDPAESVMCVPESTVAYGAPPNTGAIHHELTDPQKGSASRWQDAAHQAMMRRAAVTIAQDCTRYKLPTRKLNYLQLRLGWRGLCGHIDVSKAWHQTTHVDPGPDFPWTQFLAMVKAAQKSPSTGDDDMPQIIAASVHTPRLIPANVWTGIVLQEGPPSSPTIAKGPNRVAGVIQVYLDHAISGGQLQAYVVKYDGTVAKIIDQAGSVDVAPGQVHLILPVTKSLATLSLLRLRLLAHEDCTVTYVRSELNQWSLA